MLVAQQNPRTGFLLGSLCLPRHLLHLCEFLQSLLRSPQMVVGHPTALQSVEQGVGGVAALPAGSGHLVEQRYDLPPAEQPVHLVSGATQTGQSALVFLRIVQVLSQHRVFHGLALLPLLFQDGGHDPVVLAPQFPGNLVIEHFPDLRVGEHVDPVCRRYQPMSLLQPEERFEQVDPRHARRLLQHPGAKRRTDHRGHLQQLAVFGVQLVHAPHDQGVHPIRNHRLCKAVLHRPDAAFAVEHLLVVQQLQHLHRNKGIALGLIEEEIAELLAELRLQKKRTDQLHHRVPAQPLQPHFLELTIDVKLVDNPA